LEMLVITNIHEDRQYMAYTKHHKSGTWEDRHYSQLLVESRAAS